MTTRERLEAAHAKPPTAEDIDKAVECIRNVKQEANRIRSSRYSVMNPAPLPGVETAIFAGNVLDLAYHAGWMARKLRNQLEGKSSP